MKINQVGSSGSNESTRISRPVEHRPQEYKNSEVSKPEESRPDVIHRIHLEEVKEKEIDDSVLEESVKQANKSLMQFNRYIEREVHDVTKTVMYTLRDSQTKEVIAEFPPKKIQDMIAKMWELAGLFVDEKA